MARSLSLFQPPKQPLAGTIGVREALAVDLKLFSIVIDTRAPPGWMCILPANEPELARIKQASAAFATAWIDESLILSEFELEERDEWVRGLMERLPFS